MPCTTSTNRQARRSLKYSRLAWVSSDASMAITDNLRDHSIEAIEEYLAIANVCVEGRKPDGGIWGYPAALLLLCATDAIGNGLPSSRRGGYSRLKVLNHPHFGLRLRDGQIKQLREWYRNPLAHNAQLYGDVDMTDEPHGDPFDFKPDGSLTRIRVPVFNALVKRGWDKSMPEYNPEELRQGRATKQAEGRD
jgi:hypothetical protein